MTKLRDLDAFFRLMISAKVDRFAGSNRDDRQLPRQKPEARRCARRVCEAAAESPGRYQDSYGKGYKTQGTDIASMRVRAESSSRSCLAGCRVHMQWYANQGHGKELREGTDSPIEKELSAPRIRLTTLCLLIRPLDSYLG